MTPEFIERLEQVVRVLEELPPERRLDQSSWVTCGTAACACGWAGMDPWFMERGFITEKRYGSYTVLYYTVPFRLDCTSTGRSAVLSFFGILNEDFRRLFMDDDEEMPKSKDEVIGTLKDFIGENS